MHQAQGARALLLGSRFIAARGAVTTEARLSPLAVTARALRSFSAAAGAPPAAGSRLSALRAALRAEPPGARLRAPPSSPPRAAGAGAAPAGVRPALVDSHGRAHTYLRVSLTERCNLRCTYCMPAGGAPLSPPAELLTPDETVALVGVFAALGVSKVRLTGGEPTLRPDLPELVRRVRAAGVATVAVTTNGVLLERQLPALVAAGLTHVNVSCDTLRPERFAAIARRPPEAWHRVRAAVAAALGAGLPGRVKLNVVLERGVNDDEVAHFAALTLGAPLHVRFIELMPFAGNDWRPEAVVPTRDAVEAIRRVYPGFAPSNDADNLAEGGGGGSSGGGGAPAAPSTSAVGVKDTARLWRVPGAVGRVGFITTMTSAFCSTCSRLRLTADGALRTCLHGAEEVSLRDVLRGAGGDAGAARAALEAAIAAALAGKHAALGGERGLAARMAAAKLGLPAPAGREMVRIGG